MLIQIRTSEFRTEIRRVSAMAQAMVESGILDESAALGTLVEERIDRSRPVSQQKPEEECPTPQNKEKREQSAALLQWAALVVALYMNEDYEVVLRGSGEQETSAPVEKKVSLRVRLKKALRKVQGDISSLAQSGWDTVVNHGVLGMWCRRALVLQARLAAC